MSVIDYKSVYYDKLEKNRKKVRDDVLKDNKDMKIKINNYSEKFCEPIPLIKHKILNDSLFADHFAKDPAKQGIHQKTAAKFIENITDVINFCILPAGGKKAMYICEDGTLERGSSSKRDGVKSIDFYWEFDGKQYYAAHKYTELEGGAQDNQFNDLMAFMKNASQANISNTVFLAIGDGDYYQRSYTKVKNDYSTRIDYLNGKYGVEGKVAAITTDDLEDFLVSNSSFIEVEADCD